MVMVHTLGHDPGIQYKIPMHQPFPFWAVLHRLGLLFIVIYDSLVARQPVTPNSLLIYFSVATLLHSCICENTSFQNFHLNSTFLCHFVCSRSYVHVVARQQPYPPYLTKVIFDIPLQYTNTNKTILIQIPLVRTISRKFWAMLEVMYFSKEMV